MNLGLGQTTASMRLLVIESDQDVRAKSTASNVVHIYCFHALGGAE